MRKLAAATVAVAVTAAAFAAFGAGAPSRGAAPDSTAPNVRPRQKLPPLPAEVRRRKKWKIGVKCDFPPFGYINVRGQNAGYDVEVARWFARFAFGSSKRVDFDCVTTPSRIPALQTKRVDIIVSTLTYTPARDEVIDFSTPYYSATGRLLVQRTSTIRTLNDIHGKTVSTTRGSIYDRWVKNCFSDTQLLVVDSPSAALLAVRDGRADTFMFDDAFLLGVVSGATVGERGTWRLTRDKFLNIPWGIGIRQGETAMKRWVDSRLRRLQQKDEFFKILKRNSPAELVDDFAGNVPRPRRSFKYPTGELEKVCP